MNINIVKHHPRQKYPLNLRNFDNMTILSHRIILQALKKCSLMSVAKKLAKYFKAVKDIFEVSDLSTHYKIVSMLKCLTKQAPTQ